jgi:hypothetical protein
MFTVTMPLPSMLYQIVGSKELDPDSSAVLPRSEKPNVTAAPAKPTRKSAARERALMMSLTH